MHVQVLSMSGNCSTPATRAPLQFAVQLAGSDGSEDLGLVSISARPASLSLWCCHDGCLGGGDAHWHEHRQCQSAVCGGGFKAAVHWTCAGWTGGRAHVRALVGSEVVRRRVGASLSFWIVGAKPQRA